MYTCTQCKEEARYLIANKCYDCFHKVMNAEEYVLTKTQANDIINSVIDEFSYNTGLEKSSYDKIEVEGIVTAILDEVRLEMVNELRKL